MILRIVLLASAFAATACGGKPAAPTTPDPSGGASYGGASYGAAEPTSEPRPDPCGGDPVGY